MHRRSVSRLSDIRPSNISLRGYKTAGKFRDTVRVPRTFREDPPDVKDWTQKVIKGAAIKDRTKGWKHSRHIGGLEKVLTADIQTAQNCPLVQSTEKTQFFSTENGDDQDLDVFGECSAPSRKYDSGTFVEIRRNEIVTHGVILGEIIVAGSTKLATLTSFGEVWDHLQGDVTFMLPNFIDRLLSKRCGSEALTADEHQVAARVRVIKKLRDFDKQIEIEYNRINGYLISAYEQWKSPDPEQWSKVTTSQVAKLVSPTATPSVVSLISVHKHLMRRSTEFIADPTNFTATNTFWVRPQSHVEHLNSVRNLIIRNDQRVDDFVAKARTAIAQSRSRATTSWSDPPSQHPAHGTQAFTDSDIAIIRFLQHSIHTRRSIQKDPYIVPVSSIMKRLKSYEGKVNGAMVHNCLVDLGVFTPWDDPVTQKSDMVFLEHGGNVEKTIPLVTCSAAPWLRRLGSRNLYSNDIVESLRHDFGNLPVYVIDDVGAEELDDGLSIEPVPSEPGVYWIHTHIADPTAILPPNHTVSLNALRRIQTLYLVQETIPLLPQLPNYNRNGLGSGAETGQAEKVLTFSYKIDRTGSIVDYAVRPALIRNVKICRYDDVNAVLGLHTLSHLYPFGNSPVAPVSPSYSQSEADDLRSLYTVTQWMNDQLLKKTEAMNVTLPSASVSMSPKSPPANPSDISRPPISSGFPYLQYAIEYPASLESGSRKMVATCMITASRVASRFFRDRGIPAIRRTAGRLITPSESMFAEILQLRDASGNISMFELMKRNVGFSSAEYTTQIKGHWQMGIPDGEGYVRVTSPLRRYVDMIAHWQIKYALLSPSGPPLFSEQWLKEFALDLETKEDRIRKIDKMHGMFWALKFITRWMEHPEVHADREDPLQSLTALRVGEFRVDALTQVNHAAVYIPSLGLRAKLIDVDNHEAVEMGQPYPVKIDSILLGLKPVLTVRQK